MRKILGGQPPGKIGNADISLKLCLKQSFIFLTLFYFYDILVLRFNVKCWDNGYATEAVREALKYGIEECLSYSLLKSELTENYYD